MSDISMAADFSDGQAHGMSHPMAQAEGVQHVSDAAWLTYEATFPGLEGHRAEVEADQVIAGAVLRTVGEWQSLRADLAFARGLLEGMLAESIALRGEICELQKRLRERNDGGRNEAACVERLEASVADGRMDSEGQGAATGTQVAAAVQAAFLAQSLTLLPETDARLGRGNAAMDHE